MDNDKYNKWKSDHYHKDDVGYFTDVVRGFRVYYTEDDVLKEYTKQKNWCDDPADEGNYKKFRFGFKYDLYF